MHKLFCIFALFLQALSVESNGVMLEHPGLLSDDDGNMFAEYSLGSDITISCKGTHEDEDIRWILPTNSEIEGFNQHDFNKRVKIKQSSEYHKTLKIKNAQVTDAGEYACTTVSNSSVEEFYLFVKEPDVYFLKPRESTLSFDSFPIRIPCRTTKFLTPNEVQLFINNKKVSIRDHAFDPRIGFTLNQNDLDGHDLQGSNIKCKYATGSSIYEPHFFVKSTKIKTKLPVELLIIPQHYFPYKGAEHFTITCMIRSHLRIPYIERQILEMDCPRCNHKDVLISRPNKRSQDSRQLNATFILHELSSEDAGQYTCKWKQENGAHEESVYNMVVSDDRIQIKIEQQQSRIVISENQDTALSAYVSSFPENYQINWKKVHTELDNNKLDSKLVDIKRGDHYDFNSSPYDKATNETLVLLRPTYKQTANYTLTISVENVEKSVSWEVIVQAPPSLSMDITSAANFTQFGQRYFIHNTPLLITCKSFMTNTFAPYLRYKMSDDETLPHIDVPSNELEFFNGSFETALIWRTTASNMIVKCENMESEPIEQKIAVSLKKSSATHAAKDIKEGFSEKKIYSGDDIVLTCYAPPNKLSTMRWFYNNKQIEDYELLRENDLYTLRGYVKSISKSGKYVCEIQQGDQRETHITYVTVNKPIIPTFTDYTNYNRDITVEYPGHYLLNCSMDGDPFPEIYWTLNNRAITEDVQEDGQVLKFQIIAENAGEFVCTGTNRAGIIQRNFNVEVKGAPTSSTKLIIFIVLVCICVIVVVMYIATKRTQKRKRQNDKEMSNMVELLLRGQQFKGTSNATNDAKVDLMQHNEDDEDEDDLFYSQAMTQEISRKFYIKKKQIQFVKPAVKLGQGNFGCVEKAILCSNGRYSKRMTIAVKKPLVTRAEKYFTELLCKEIKVLSALPPHPNVLSFIGFVNLDTSVWLITEFCDNGNLLKFLSLLDDSTFHNEVVRPVINSPYELPISRVPSDKYMAEIPGKTAEKMATIKSTDEENVSLLKESTNASHESSTSELLSFAMQIANGMTHLEAHKCFHRDLSARNILLKQNGIAKIADFGLARRSNKSSYEIYEMTTMCDIPIYCTSPESYLTAKYNSKSDVWSYGILLYEIFTLGKTPYTGWSHDDLKKYYAADGDEAENPNLKNVIYAPSGIVQLMRRCLTKDVVSRANFKECYEIVEHNLMRCNSALLESTKKKILEEQKNMVVISNFQNEM